MFSLVFLLVFSLVFFLVFFSCIPSSVLPFEELKALSPFVNVANCQLAVTSTAGVEHLGVCVKEGWMQNQDQMGPMAIF